MTAFFDTNVVIYAQQAGTRGDRARMLLAGGGVVSAQVLNEAAAVLSRKFGRGWDEIAEALADLRALCGPARALSEETTLAALALARQDGLSFYDALIVAAALEAGCDTLLSEDMQDGRAFSTLTIRNPFRDIA